MDIAEIIGNVGFPVAVTFYLLVRIESRLELLTDSINTLSSYLKVMPEKIRDNEKTRENLDKVA